MFQKKNFSRMALMGNPWLDTYVKWVQQGYPTRRVYKEVGETCWNPADGNEMKVTKAGDYIEPVPVWEHFNYDMTLVSGFWDYHPLIDYHKVIEENADWEIYENGSGAQFKYWKHRMGTPEHIAFQMTTREIWEKTYRPHLLDFDPVRINLLDGKKRYTAATNANVWRYFGHQNVFESARSSMGDITLYESLLLDPGWIHDYCRVYTDFFKRGFQYQFDHIGLPDGVWLYEDLGYKNGLFASPRTYQQLIFPYYKEMIDFFHAYQLPVVLHSCGSVAQALDLIVEAGFDALNPIERKANHNDPFLFAEKYGKDLVFIGGLDVRVLETNQKDTIQKETRLLLEGMKSRNARLVFTEDHSIPPTVNLDSYQWMLDAFWKYCEL
jgi:uroporphyrinogen decarboxylase